MPLTNSFCYSYSEAKNKVDECRNPEKGKEIAYATRIRLGEEGIEIVHFSTPIITILPGDKYIIDPEGFRSRTTLDRINTFTPRDVHVYQRQWIWYINWWFMQDIPFEDGIIVW